MKFLLIKETRAYSFQNITTFESAVYHLHVRSHQFKN